MSTGDVIKLMTDLITTCRTEARRLYSRDGQLANLNTSLRLCHGDGGTLLDAFDGGLQEQWSTNTLRRRTWSTCTRSIELRYGPRWGGSIPLMRESATWRLSAAKTSWCNHDDWELAAKDILRPGRTRYDIRIRPYSHRSGPSGTEASLLSTLQSTPT